MGEAIPSSRWLAWIFLRFSGFFSRELLRHFRAQNLADFSSYSLHISLGPEVCSVRPGQRVAVPGWPRQPGDSRVLPGSDTRNKQPQGLKEFTITFFVCITGNVENSCFVKAVFGQLFGDSCSEIAVRGQIAKQTCYSIYWHAMVSVYRILQFMFTAVQTFGSHFHSFSFSIYSWNPLLPCSCQ